MSKTKDSSLTLVTYEEVYYNAIRQLRNTDVYGKSENRIAQLITLLSDKLPEDDKSLILQLVDAVMEQVALEYDYANLSYGLTSFDYAFKDVIDEVNLYNYAEMK